MLTFSTTRLAIPGWPQAASPARTANGESPVRFDPQLVGQLLAFHERLNARFAHLLCVVDNDAKDAAATAQECIDVLHELRRSEAVRLYPAIALAIDDDAAAHRQLMQLRMVMVALVRRVGRSLEELLLAIAEQRHTRALVERISAPLADYVRRSANEIYPLYGLLGMEPARQRSA